jgi:hypothetical protein
MGRALQPPFQESIQALTHEISPGAMRLQSNFNYFLAVCFTLIGIFEVARPLRDPILHVYGACNIILGIAYAVVAVVRHRRAGHATSLRLE